jgi:hypothetical protein
VGVTSNNSTMGSVSGSGTYNHNSTATLTATSELIEIVSHYVNLYLVFPAP